jgi:prepilin-type N-terminal cleavage/methylation domain-containing protein
MRRQRGFTLLEMMVTVAIIAIVAGVAFVGMRAARRNASVGGASFELVLKLQGLRTKALAEQRDLLAVLVAGDGGACDLLRSAGCVRMFVLAAPASAWTLEDFSPASPGASLDADAGAVVDQIVLPRGLTLHGAAAGMAGKPPFANVEAWDPELDATCGSVRCVAFRFAANGEVRGETPDGTVLRKPGHIVALATDLEGQSGAAERRAVLVSFPSGIVKSYTY